MSSRLGVITATFNAMPHLPGLADSINEQTCKDFYWYVADGGSTDGTVDFLSTLEIPQLIWSSAPDGGIYDAINKCIEICEAEYYVVLGADDRLFPAAVERYLKATLLGADIISLAVMKDNKLLFAKGLRPWIHGHKAFVSEHSVGTLVRRSLHFSVGFYSLSYKIAADHEFILRCMLLHRASLDCSSDIVGAYGSSGVSAVRAKQALLESAKIQSVYFSSLIQYGLLFFRLARISLKGFANWVCKIGGKFVIF